MVERIVSGDAPAAAATSTGARLQVIWGREPAELHDTYWASRGVQIVRHRCGAQPEGIAELYMLVDPATLVLFDLPSAVDVFQWIEPGLMCVRLFESRGPAMIARDRAGCSGRVTEFEMSGDRTRRSRRARVALTADPVLARRWAQTSGRDLRGWSQLRRAIPQRRRAVRSIPAAFIADCENDSEAEMFLGHLVSRWRRPDASMEGVHLAAGKVLHDGSVQPPLNHRPRYPVWIGSGRGGELQHHPRGPAILWDFETIAQSPRSSASIRPVSNASEFTRTLRETFIPS
jgi:hypothetical protein